MEMVGDELICKFRIYMIFNAQAILIGGAKPI